MTPFLFRPCRALTFAISAVLLLLSMCTEIAAATPNIVVILVDDMGYGDPGCYNPESKIPTPHIDSLATTGMRFTDAHAAGPLCHLSRYGLMTGRYPFRATCGKWREEPTIREGEMTIASLLKTKGYRTAMVGKWHLGFAENGYENPLPGGPVDRGFDTYFGIRASTDIPPYFYIRGNKAVTPPTNHIAANNSDGWSPIQGAFWREGGIAPDLQLENVLPRFTNEALQVLRQHSQQNAGNRVPLMLYLAYPAPHTPWLPSREFLGRSGASLYGDFTMMVDSEVGRILAELERSGMTDDTLVIFSSDNGPTWYDNDVQRFDHDCSGGLRGMKADAWEAGHRVPFIVRWPGIVNPASSSDQTICFTDLLATLADVVDADLPDDAGPDSFSFHRVLTGRQPEGQRVREDLVIQSGSGFMTLRSGHWKLIQGLGSGGFSEPKNRQPEAGEAPGQLYNLSTDLGETNNVYAQNPDMVARLTQRLRDIQSRPAHRHR
ncbi:MAG: arylsulfatase [Planctomycetaceae bacterium]